MRAGLVSAFCIIIFYFMYKEIASNKRKTWILLTVFSIFIMLLFILLGAYLGIDPIVSLIFGSIFSIIYSLISFYTSDKTALAINGAKRISKKDSFELFTLTENLCITAGIPMPKIYVIDDDSPNAFATGRDPEHASIAVTTGLLRRLTKIELEGVIAHELSHIRNYDIRIMTIVIVLIGLVMIMSDIFLRFSIYGNRSRNNKNNQFGLIMLAIGIGLAILSPLIAQLIKLAVSRTREYLADSSAALLTRHPEGLASALEKIRDASIPMQKANHATAHLFISNPFAGKSNGFIKKMFSTHPPIEDRIAKLRTIGR